MAAEETTTTVVVKRPRLESDVSDGPVACILCWNPVQYFAMGKCNHKNVCHKCSLRIRLIMKDKKCSICKTELLEIVVSSDMSITWDQVAEKDFISDKEDSSIFYEDNKAKAAGMQLRSLQCLMYQCTTA